MCRFRPVPFDQAMKARTRAHRTSEAVMGIVVLSLEILGRFLRRTGPYLLVVLLPGGTILALLLLLYRRRGEQRWMKGMRFAKACVPRARSQFRD
jgi:hypothetical protein